MHAIRWLAVIPSAFVGWFLAFAAVAAAHRTAFAFCPPEAVVSGACLAPWFQRAEFALSVAFAALAAVLVVLLPTLVAPAKRRGVAWSAFASGSLVAAYFAAQTSVWLPVVAALLAGLGVALFLSKRYERAEA